MGSHYNTKIQIWTKEIIDVVIEVVRCEELEDGYRYGESLSECPIRML